MTKRQRHSCYKKLLKIVCKDPETSRGFCFYMRDLGFNTYNKEDFQNNFPELYSFKPKRMAYGFLDYWFPCNYKGWEKRIEILQKCIEMTKP